MNTHTSTRAQIAKYEAHLAADDALIQNSNHPEKYLRRRANHAAKLQRKQAHLNSLINADTQKASTDAEKTASLVFSCSAHKRGEITLNVTLPDGTTETTRATRCLDLFHIADHLLSLQAAAWLRTANILHFNLYTAAKLRSGKKHTIHFNPQHYKTLLKDIHTDRNGMRVRPNTINLEHV